MRVFTKLDRAQAVVYATLVLTIVAPELASSRKLSGTVQLGPGQAKVVAKFCFDFNTACKDGQECTEPPGQADFEVFAARDLGGKLSKAGDPNVFISLLDDEYFSFPEVSQVWGEANCSDVRKSAKKSYPLGWAEVSSSKGSSIKSVVVEKVRPRWWYISFVSCSQHSLEMNYRITLANLLQGSSSQLSMDEIGVLSVCAVVFLTFAGLGALHANSAMRWAECRCGAPGGHFLVGASILLAILGELCWLSYFHQYKVTGECSEWTAVLARMFVVAAKTLLQILLMLLAHGQSVCSPGIAWVRQKEMVAGMVVFGCLGLILEVWGDREASGSPVEYIYDTRPGVALVALELMWLYAYCSRCWQTWVNETRRRPRHFYKHFASLLSLWFVSLPAVAGLASFLAPWVRFRITFMVNSAAHVAVVAALVYIFYPGVASELLEMKSRDHEAAHHKHELASFLSGDPEDDDFW
eukprot:TRINITY_DN22535_c0_g1_i2.p1 TRINITY_DN22535_c0_g1~~TRINITY_DN22535_c0_g1_i2.p1  ORF type:complete len:467 (-),score=81.05 TRINITY_DN22535_c0_g1_i2:31-1431(-)